jgi:hypothetical protein
MVNRGGKRHGDMSGEPGDHIGSSFAQHKNVIAVIVVKGRANVPAVLFVWGPCGALVGLDVNEYSGAWGRDRCAIEVIVSVHLVPGQQLQVDVGARQKVESEDGLIEQAVPQWCRKSGSVLHRPAMK